MVLKAVFTDTFNRSNVNPIGAPWNTTTSVSAMQVVSNTAQPTTSAGPRCGVTYAASPLSDMRSTITLASTISTATSQIAAVVRSSLTAFSGYVGLAGGEFNIYSVVSGGFTSIAATSGNPPTAGQTLGVESIGSTIKCYEDGTQVLSQTDSTHVEGVWGMDTLIFSGTDLTDAAIDSFTGEAEPGVVAAQPVRKKKTIPELQGRVL